MAKSMSHESLIGESLGITDQAFADTLDLILALDVKDTQKAKTLLNVAATFMRAARVDGAEHPQELSAEPIELPSQDTQRSGARQTVTTDREPLSPQPPEAVTLPAKDQSPLPPSAPAKAQPAEAPIARAKDQSPSAPVASAVETRTAAELAPNPKHVRRNDSPIASIAPPITKGVELQKVELVSDTSVSDGTSVSGASASEPLRRPKTRRVVAAASAGAITVSGLMVAASPDQGNAGELLCEAQGMNVLQIGKGSGPEEGLIDKIRKGIDVVSPFEDGRQWPVLAKKYSNERGYYISPERLAAANPTAIRTKDKTPQQLAEYNKDGLAPTIKYVGEYCIKVPGPVVGGQIETDNADTLRLVSAHTTVPIAELRKLNPGLPDNDNALLGPGKVVRIAKKLDTSLVLQQADKRTLEDIADPTSPNASGVYAKVLEANEPIIAKHGSLDAGLRYWPPKAKKPAAKGAPAQEVPAVEPAPSDFAEKPKPEAKKDTVEQKTLSLEDRKKLIDTLAISPEQKAQLTKFVETLAAMPESETKGVRTDVVLAQAIQSSNWGTSEAAKYNNFFGLKANKGWKGKTVKIITNDARRDQDQSVVEYRVYDSMADAFKDYVSAIRNSTDFKTHGNDAFVDHAALADLYGGDVLDFRTELLFQLLMDAKFDGKKFKDYQVAGGIGGFIIESAHTLSPTKKEMISPERLAELGREAAEGIGQWQEGRAVDRKEFQQKHGVSTTADGMFVIYELQHKEKSRLKPILDADDLESAAIAWRVHYERPSAPHDDRRIEEAYYAMGVHTRAQAHGKALRQAITQYKLAELAGWAAPEKAPKPAPQAPRPTTQPQGPKVVIKEQAGPIDLKPNEYAKVQRPLPGNGSGGARINADDNPATGTDGNEVRSSALSYNERVKVIERELNQAQASISAERCQQFQIKDVSGEVRKKFARNFVGSRTGLGGPNKPSDIQHFVVHFTATNTAVNDIDGITFASSMYNSGVLGVNYHINNKGETSLLTKDFTYHAKNFRGHAYNGHSYGMEVSASEQSEINAEQYESIVYLATNFLIEQGFVSKDKPVSEAVKRVIGHREANAADGMHHDFPSLVMDPVRSMIVNLLVSMGYTR